MALGFSSPFGTGSIQIDITGGPPSGSYFLAVDVLRGRVPSGWLFGVDMPLAGAPEPPHDGLPVPRPARPCGSFTIGPFGGLGFLSGLPLYAVALGLPPGSASRRCTRAAVTLHDSLIA